jgi:SAM-dependent methyltransferase
MSDPRTQLVADGYDAIGETFAGWRERIVGDPRREWEDDLVSRLQDGAAVLELGCGAGTAETRRLASRFRVTGVDVSPLQVERARTATSRLVRETGFAIVRDELVTFEEPEGPATFQWVLARR